MLKLLLLMYIFLINRKRDASYLILLFLVFGTFAAFVDASKFYINRFIEIKNKSKSTNCTKQLLNSKSKSKRIIFKLNSKKTATVVDN